MDKVLVTGGAGFIGSHLVDALVKQGYEVRIIDNLDPQVHTSKCEYINPNAEFLRYDVRHYDSVVQAMWGVDVVVHLAASVGVGQSMYNIREYVENNSLGGANILQAILRCKQKYIKKIVVASSMSCYGEGAYYCTHGYDNPINTKLIYPPIRSISQLENKLWELLCPDCGAALVPLPTNESKPLEPTSIYAITKRDHEEMFLMFGRAYKIPTIALRFFNVYGPRQSLSNPYTGVAAVFSSRLLNNKSPIIFEDGSQSRDFVHVNDIVQALILSIQNDTIYSEVFNVGTGMSTNLLQLLDLIKGQLRESRLLNARVQQDIIDADTPPAKIIEKFREGDVRHCYADISKISQLLGYSPTVLLKEGVKDLISWAKDQESCDKVDQATKELEERGLV